MNATHVLSKFCGSKHEQKAVATSTNNKVYVNFYSDMSYAGRGFSASYKSINSSKFIAVVCIIMTTYIEI